MKIFVAYGYRPEDAWIELMIFPIIRAFGSEVVHGKDLFGRPIAGGVQERIRQSDALIAFLTRRDPQQDGNFSTHSWVMQEVALALAVPMKAGEVWETKVTPAGIAQNQQRMTYDASSRDQFLVEFVTMMGEWHSESVERPQLVPQEVLRLYRRYKNDPSFRCTYTVRRGFSVTPPVQADPKKDIYETAPSQLYVMLRNVRRGDLVSIEMQGGGEAWASPFTNVDDISIQMERSQ